MTTFGDDTSNNNDDGIDWRYLIMNHICPAAGVILSTLMYSAAISDLKQCILCGSLGSLNPIPWAIQMGNCFVSCSKRIYTDYIIVNGLIEFSHDYSCSCVFFYRFVLSYYQN